MTLWTPERSNNLISAVAGRGTPGGHVAVAAAPLLLQFRTVAVLVYIGAGVGCRREGWEGGKDQYSNQ